MSVVKYKCHYCGLPLINGKDYSLECSCGNCKMSFDRTNLIAFSFVVLDKGKEYLILKERYKEKISLIQIKSSFQKIKYWSAKSILDLKVEIKFEDGMPQVYKMFDKLKGLVIFS